MFAGFNFVAAQALFCFYLFGIDSFNRAILAKLHFVGSIHSIFGAVIMALLACFANKSNDFSFVAFFSHKPRL